VAVHDSLALAWLRSLGGLPEGDARIGAAARELERAEPIEAAHALGELITGASTDPLTSRVAAALIRALVSARPEDLPADARERITAAAIEFQIDEVAVLFSSDAPARQMAEGEALRTDPALDGLSLGHKRQLARSIDPERAARFVAESDPSVVGNLLLNPRLTEDLVVRVAARRPARAEALRQIWNSARWSTRRRVKLALAHNPYAEPEVVLKILPLLGGPDLRGVAEDSTLHPIVRAAARRLIETRRPPDPDR
jgi:hypothetical protein